ncbi:MAG: FHA domain-containing protein [Thermoanaerobaculia bacterium]
MRADLFAHPSPEAALCYQIRVVYPNGRSIDLESKRRLLYIGRTQGNDLRLAHPFVSARHLVLRVVAGEFRITDLGSTTGTRLGGTLLVPLVEQPVREGDVIELGPLKLSLSRILEAEVLSDTREEPLSVNARRGRGLQRGWESEAGTYPRLELEPGGTGPATAAAFAERAPLGWLEAAGALPRSLPAAPPRGSRQRLRRTLLYAVGGVLLASTLAALLAVLIS